MIMPFCSIQGAWSLFKVKEGVNLIVRMLISQCMVKGVLELGLGVIGDLADPKLSRTRNYGILLVGILSTTNYSQGC